MSKDMNVVQQTYKWLSIADQHKYTEEELVLKAQLVLDLLKEEVTEFQTALLLGNRKEMLNACADLLVVASNLPYFAGFGLDELTEECDKTYLSNSTKFCRSAEEALLTQQAYTKGEHPNKIGKKITVEIHNSGNTMWPYVVKTPDGKIMKSINFKDVE